jgi:uncharacterized protein
MSEIRTTAAYESEIRVRSDEERIIDIRLVPWGVIASTPEGRERFARGAFAGTLPAEVTLEAIGPHGAQPGVTLAGRALELEDREDAAYGAFRVSRTRAGDELLELARDGVYRAASVVFEPAPNGSRVGPDGVIERRAARLIRVGIVERGAYPGAAVRAVRGADMTQEPIPDPTPDPVPNPTPDPVPPGTRVEILARSEDLEALRADMVSRMAVLEGSAGRAALGSPFARWNTLAEYLDAAYVDKAAGALLARALVDQTTTLNPGVMGVAGEIAGIIPARRPAIEALGGAGPLGADGMDLEWPYIDPALDLDTLVAKQAAEKSEIHSVLVKILKGANAIDTFAGGSDVSYQLIRRSRPAYREAYVKILTIGYARATEARFEADLAAGAGGSEVLAAGANADAVRAFLFAASAEVEDATGAPATVDLVSPAEYARLGGLPGLMPPAYGVSNVAGTAQASTLQINVSGLPIIRAPFLTGNLHLVTNGEAARWHEDGPFPISAEDVAKLGQNVAVWGMGATAITIPAGIVASTAVARDAEAAGSRKR